MPTFLSPKHYFKTNNAMKNQTPTISTQWVDSPNSPEFEHLTHSLSLSSVIALDAEWKPTLRHTSFFPTVALLQIACRLGPTQTESTQPESRVFLLDLLSIPLDSVYGLLRDVFVSPQVLKLGFRFKQDLAYVSATFCAQGCDPGFDKVEPFIDITSVYNHLKNKQPGRKTSKQNKSLATICEEVLGIFMSKELQCSDWSLRPLTEEQKAYAAADAHCLLEIFNVFQIEEDSALHDGTKFGILHPDLGLKEILEEPTISENILRNKYCEALDIIRASMPKGVSEFSIRINNAKREASTESSLNIVPMDNSIWQIIRKYGDKIVLNESNRYPKRSKRKTKRKTSGGLTCKEKLLVNIDSWQGPPPWDLSLGGDGSPKFLCDVMVEGLAKHLRCVGIDAAIPYSKKAETRDLIHQAQREKRVLLTRDAKLLRHEYLIQNQIYRVKSLLKNEQLLEVIETFQLKISEDQLMTRCTKCNGKFIQKPLTTGEAVEASKGFQIIPNCLFDKNLEFWQCMDCNQLYWEGTQYHNAVQKFIDVCKLQT